MKKQKGITLISLIVTIIILLILAAVTLNLTVGENGIFKIAEKAGTSYNEKQAQEKLELVLVELQAKKKTDTHYNENEYIDNKIKEKGMQITGNIVTVDKWKFQIDRTVPKIVATVENTQENEKININATQEIASDYTKSTIKIEITYENEITKIQISGEEITIPEKQEGKYIIEKEVTSNGNYSIYAEDEKGHKTTSIKVEEISEDITIYTTEQLEWIRNRVNKGATYEGKTITLGNNIDLNEGKYDIAEDGTITFHEDATKWTPIGSKEHPFKGTFDGNNKTISGLYINASTNYQALFGYNSGTIKNMNINGTVTNTATYTSIVTGVNNENAIISNIVTSGKVQGYNHTGGIAGYNLGEIKECGNLAKISATGNYAGGIAGGMRDATVSKCYNKAEVTGKSYIRRSYRHNIW